MMSWLARALGREIRAIKAKAYAHHMVATPFVTEVASFSLNDHDLFMIEGYYLLNAHLNKSTIYQRIVI